MGHKMDGIQVETANCGGEGFSRMRHEERDNYVSVAQHFRLTLSDIHWCALVTLHQSDDEGPLGPVAQCH
jgi:hypothetical protein